LSLTNCAACGGADTVMPPPPQVVTWTVTESFQVRGHRALVDAGHRTPSVYQVWSS